MALPALVVAIMLVGSGQGGVSHNGLGPGGADPGVATRVWDPQMPSARAIWFGAQRLVELDSVYRITEPGAPGGFPLTITALVFAAPMSVGGWFLWQLVFLTASVIALCWLVKRAFPRLNAAATGLGTAALVIVCAPVRAALSAGSVDIVLIALMVSGLWPRGSPTALDRSAAPQDLATRRTMRGLGFLSSHRHVDTGPGTNEAQQTIAVPGPAIRLGLAGALGLGPIVAIAPLLLAGGDGAGSVTHSVRRGTVAGFVVILLNGCAFLVAPWNGTDFWRMLLTGTMTRWPGLDPSLGARIGLVGWLVGAAALLVALAVARCWARRGDLPAVVIAVCAGLSIGVPGHWAGAAVPAVVAGLLALVAGGGRWRFVVAAWSLWTCLAPIDLFAGSHPGLVALWSWGSIVGALGAVVAMAWGLGRGRHPGSAPGGGDLSCAPHGSDVRPQHAHHPGGADSGSVSG